MKILYKYPSIALLILIPTAANTADTDNNLFERLRILEGRVERVEDELREYRNENSADHIGLLEPNDASGSTGEKEKELTKLITVDVSNKKSVDITYGEVITWNSVFIDNGLSSDARSIKGTLIFADLFREPRFRVRVTIDDPIKKGGMVQQLGSGIDYNQFMDDHQWLKNTNLEDMAIWFETDQILYSDGRLESAK